MKSSMIETSSDAMGHAVVEVGIGIVIRDTPNVYQTEVLASRGAYDILITRRPEHTVYGGYWELPGGKAEAGEGIEGCVVRELSEEVGVSVVVIGTLPTVGHTYAHGSVRLHPRVCRMVAGSGEPRNLGVAEHRWVRMAEMGGYRFPEANAAIIAALEIALREGIEWV